MYILLNLLYKINDKFGSGMTTNILLAKESKVKAYMTNYEEYGSGLSFGNDNWWKEFIRILMSHDYLIETQVKGSFGSTLSLTNKGKVLRKKLTDKYPKYLNLLQEIERDIKLMETKTVRSIKLLFYLIQENHLDVLRRPHYLNVKNKKSKTHNINGQCVQNKNIIRDVLYNQIIKKFYENKHI